MTPLEKLRALAAAKKLPQTSTVDLDLTVEKKIEPVPIQDPEVIPDENVSRVTTQGNQVQPELSQDKAKQGPEVSSDEDLVLVPGDPKEGESSNNDEPSPGNISRLAEDHPLKMQLAELEQALTEKLPEFRTILRDIHAKLRQDPDCVTAMSEDEIGSIVQGLIHHANVDVIAPRAIKSAKKASKVPISASDL